MRIMNRATLLAAFKEYRADGYEAPVAHRLAFDHLPLVEKTAADIAMHRATTRARLLTGMRDTWRLAYSVARIEA
jgi:hypothetical protein